MENHVTSPSASLSDSLPADDVQSVSSSQEHSQLRRRPSGLPDLFSTDGTQGVTSPQEHSQLRRRPSGLPDALPADGARNATVPQEHSQLRCRPSGLPHRPRSVLASSDELPKLPQPQGAKETSGEKETEGEEKVSIIVSRIPKEVSQVSSGNSCEASKPACEETGDKLKPPCEETGDKLKPPCEASKLSCEETGEVSDEGQIKPAGKLGEGSDSEQSVCEVAAKMPTLPVLGKPAVTSVQKACPGDAIEEVEPIEAEPAGEAPDISEDVVVPKSELERTLVFERAENRWEAAHYSLPEVGDTVGNYRITSLLGKGGFGAVYCAKNLSLGREEALKLILPSAKSEVADIDKRFSREVDIVSRLEHPNIVRLYSSGLLEHNILWMTMELVIGTRLDDRLHQHGPMKFSQAKNLMLQLLSGLMEAHRRQIVHRDLKPANIMLSKKEGYKDQVIILDFGLSKALGMDENAKVQDVTVVDTRRIFGTPQYMAPEQLSQAKLGPWTDVYAAGLILFEMLTGDPAVQGDSLLEVAFKQSHEPIVYPHAMRDTAIAAILDCACAKNPAHRYRDAGEFFNALQHVEDVNDPPSVLRQEHRGSGSLASMGMLAASRDQASQSQTLVSLEPIACPQGAHRSSASSGRTGEYRAVESAGRRFVNILAYALAALFIIVVVLWALNFVSITLG
ncbi:MAG: serine/threonine protein kinase [Proteobacteria bacterium]|nr:serine/threonine protein kinase [Pseudomonadota bacterium]